MSQKILLIDDDKINTTLVKFTLAEKGYEVTFASDGQEGLEAFKNDKPDLIILDVQMPNMNGYEFMGELNALDGHGNTPVLMLTANETMEDMFKLEGVKGYFVKPIDPPVLVKKIQDILGPIEKEL